MTFIAASASFLVRFLATAATGLILLPVLVIPVVLFDVQNTERPLALFRAGLLLVLAIAVWQAITGDTKRLASRLVGLLAFLTTAAAFLGSVFLTLAALGALIAHLFFSFGPGDSFHPETYAAFIVGPSLKTLGLWLVAACLGHVARRLRREENA